MHLSVCEGGGGGGEEERGRELKLEGEEWGGVIQGRKRAQDLVCRYGGIIIIIQLPFYRLEVQTLMCSNYIFLCYFCLYLFDHLILLMLHTCTTKISNLIFFVSYEIVK